MENPAQDQQSFSSGDDDAPSANTELPISSFTPASSLQPILTEDVEPATVGSGVAEFAASAPTVSGYASVPQPLGGYNSVAPPSVVAPKKKKNLLAIGIASGLFVTLLAGGGVYGYTQYQKPENVVLQAITGALSAKMVRTTTAVTSDFVYTSDIVKLSLSKFTLESGFERTPRFDANAKLELTYNNRTITLNAASLVTDAGDIYFKIENARDALSKFLPDGQKLSAQAEKYLASIDGKWAKYTLAELKADNAEYGEMVQCSLDASKKYRDDKKSIQELATVYKANQFLVVDGKRLIKDGNQGYVVSVSRSKYNAFEKAAEKTTLARALTKCENGGKEPDVRDDSTGIDAPISEEKTSSDDPQTSITVWVSPWAHELRAIDTVTTNLKDFDDKSYTVKTYTNISTRKGVTTPVPTDAMSVKTWTENAGKYFEASEGVELGANPKDQEAVALAHTVIKKAEIYNAINAGYPPTVAAFGLEKESAMEDRSQLISTLPTDSSHVGYRLCKVGTAQVVYRKIDGTYMAMTLGTSESAWHSVTGLCTQL